jgi:hypothetical protein
MILRPCSGISFQTAATLTRTPTTAG